MWQHDIIRRCRGPFGIAYTCRVCGHAEYNQEKSSRAWGRIVQHVTSEHPEERTINKRTINKRTLV